MGVPPSPRASPEAAVAGGSAVGAAGVHGDSPATAQPKLKGNNKPGVYHLAPDERAINVRAQSPSDLPVKKRSRLSAAVGRFVNGLVVPKETF